MRVQAWSLGPLLSVAVLGAAGDLRLVEAVKNRNPEAARALLDLQVDVNTPQGDGATALHWTAHWNDMETLELLIGAGANVNAVNDLGVTPIALASAHQKATGVETLLAAGASPDLASETGVTPLMRAARTGSVDAARALLAGGANVNARETVREQTALMWAVAQRHPVVVRVLLENGANVHARTRTREAMVLLDADRELQRGVKTAREVGTMIKTGGSTPLLFAASHDDLESARLLLAAGANANDAAPDGNSVLVVATHSGQGELAALLLDHGADPNADGGGYTALHTAVLRSDLVAVEALLAHGANPNARLTRGMPVRRFGIEWSLPSTLVGATPFFVAAAFVDVDMMQALAAGGADPTLAILDGTSPLLAASGMVRSASANAGRRLTRPPVSAADVVRIDSYGRMDRPDLESRALGAIELLLELGVNVNARNATGDSALHGATAGGFTRVIQLLAEEGATLDLTNSHGQTPLSLTTEGRNRRVLEPAAELLRKLGATK